MRLRIVARDSNAGRRAEQLAEHRMRAAFAPLAHWVRDVVVRMGGDGGPRGRVGKTVTLELLCHGAGPMRFETRARSYSQGLAELVKRAKRSVLASPRLGGRAPRRRRRW